MIRIDKFLADSGFGTRSEVRSLVKPESVSVIGWSNYNIFVALLLLLEDYNKNTYHIYGRKEYATGKGKSS